MKNKLLFKKYELKILETIYKIQFSQKYLMDIYHPEDLMRCPIHFCLGQELLASSLSPLLRKSDYILSHHRSHGYYIAKKCPIDGMVSEFYGKEGGSNYGLAGSQELSYSKFNFFSGTILSGMFSIALGTAFSQKIKEKDISITVIGDGGMEEGICYETLNLASLHNLPILFICENNRTSVHTRIKDRTLSSNFKKKVESFDVEYLHIKSDNLENIFSDISMCVEKVRNKCKPIFVEFETFRISGHVGPENDDEEYHYRDEDIKKWKNVNIFLDHIQNIKDIKKQNYLNKKFTTIEKEIKQSVIKAKKAKEMNFERSMKLNFIKSFSKKIKKI